MPRPYAPCAIAFGSDLPLRLACHFDEQSEDESSPDK
jgi:hypothetical protein